MKTPSSVYARLSELADISDAVQDEDEDEAIPWLEPVQHLLIKYDDSHTGDSRTGTNSGLAAGFSNGRCRRSPAMVAAVRSGVRG